MSKNHIIDFEYEIEQRIARAFGYVEDDGEWKEYSENGLLRRTDTSELEEIMQLIKIGMMREPIENTANNRVITVVSYPGVENILVVPVERFNRLRAIASKLDIELEVEINNLLK